MTNFDVSSEARCLVIGAGEMAQAHVKVLAALIPDRVAVWAPSDRNRQAIEREGGQFFFGPNVVEAINSFLPTHAIIVTPVETLLLYTDRLLSAGLKNILIEKPAVLSLIDGKELCERVATKQASVKVAYNRRFYASVRTALAKIADNAEPVTSIWFEFTEWSHVIERLDSQSPQTKARWLLANSMHVIDLAFMPTGLPMLDQSTFVHSGSLKWHPTAANFAGAGFTSDGTTFAYSANWDAPGRWGVEWLTPSARYIFRPLEKLQVINRGSVAVEESPLIDDLDQRFKPGVYLQDKAFLNGDSQSLLDIVDAVELVSLANKMAGYPTNA